MDKDNIYTKMQREFYEENAPKMTVLNHKFHNANVNYWDVLLSPIEENIAKWKGKLALDLGCGCGRNLTNMHRLGEFAEVHGVDMSKSILKEAEKWLEKDGVPTDVYKLIHSNGVDLSGIKKTTYSFVMSTLVFQHIAVHDIRYSLMSEAYRVLKRKGVFSFQMGFGEGAATVDYFDNFYEAKETNSKCDVRVLDPQNIVDDLKKIGFNKVEYKILPSFSDGNHPNWIYVTAIKK